MPWIMCLQLFILFQYLGSSLAEMYTKPGSDTCVSTTDSEPMEINFLIDQSSTHVLKQMERVIDIVDDISKEYPGSKFGISGFSDFPCPVVKADGICDANGGLLSIEEPVKGKVPLYHNNSEGCYLFNTALTTDGPSIKTVVKKKTNLDYLPSGDRESGFAGLYLSVADPKMQWTRGVTGNPKIVFVVTDDETHVNKISWHTNFTSKLELKGDGTDSCTTMHNPSSQQVGDLLKKDGIGVFVLYATTAVGTGPKMLQNWKDGMTPTGLSHTFFQLDKTNQEIFGGLKAFVKKTWGGKSVFISCFDPPMYNTLGL